MSRATIDSVTDSILAGRYRMVGIIGRGSMGEVWRVHDEVLGRTVAAKVLNRAKLDDPIAEKRFEREAEAMANLSHPNIVSVYDIGVSDRRRFMIMELLSGPSVAELLREHGRLDHEQAARIGAQVARGLSAAHAIGVTHRDIKPGNVVKHDRVTKIIDFGIARLESQHEAALTAPAVAIGTAAYMSPEQARGKPVRSPSDIYSLGCLLTTMVTGAPPFVHKDPIEVARGHAMEQPDTLTMRRPDAPADLDRLVRRMLVKQPQERPNALEVAAELSRIESNLRSPALASNRVGALDARSQSHPGQTHQGQNRQNVDRPQGPSHQSTPVHQPTPTAPSELLNTPVTSRPGLLGRLFGRR